MSWLDVYAVTPAGRRVWLVGVAASIATGKRGGMRIHDGKRLVRIDRVELDYRASAGAQRRNWVRTRGGR